MSRFTRYQGLLLITALAFASASSAAPAKKNWLLNFAVTDKGAHVVGNPAAANKVVEYLSYTCGHCADFELKQAPAFKAKYVATGKASLEIRNMVLNPIDLTAATGEGVSAGDRGGGLVLLELEPPGEPATLLSGSLFVAAQAQAGLLFVLEAAWDDREAATLHCPGPQAG